jgi:hypothetical protein
MSTPHTASAWHDVVKAVVARMRARAGYRDPNDTATTGKPVYHSLEVALTEDQPDAFLMIGALGNPDQPTESGDAGQAWGTLGTRGRDEKGTVRCELVLQTGDLTVPNAVPALWDLAFDVLDDVGAVLLADPTLGLGVPRMVAQLSSLPSIRSDPARGGEITVEFLIAYDTRLRGVNT